MQYSNYIKNFSELFPYGIIGDQQELNDAALLLKVPEDDHDGTSSSVAFIHICE